MAYIPWWQRLSPPTFAERFDLGGLAGRLGNRPKRVGFRSGTLASAPWYRGTSGSSGVLKAPRGYTGMADILKHEGATIGALAINQLNKKKAKEITKGDDLPPVLPPDEPGPVIEGLEDVVASELIEKWKKKKADEMKTKASEEYRMKMRNIKKEKAITENTITISERPQIDPRAKFTLSYTPKPEVFFPQTITYNGKTYDAEKFFIDNLIKRATHGTKRKTGKTALTNEALAKLYNTNERQVERAVSVIRSAPEWNVKEPPLVDRSIYGIKVRELIANANKKLSSIELKNVNIQDKWVWQANQDLGKHSLKSIKKNKPQLIDEMQWKLVDGVIESVKRPDEKLTEDLKKFFSVNHNVKRSTEQFNIQTLVNRGLTSTKINSLLNSIEAYIKNNPTEIRKIKNFERFLKERGLRVRVDGVSETLLDKLGKKNNFFGAAPKGIFNSETGQSIQWEKYLDFLDLVLDGPEGVPLIKMAKGGLVSFASGGLAGVDQYILNRYK